jgi:RND family efflux transporter MFP subunit
MSSLKDELASLRIDRSGRGGRTAKGRDDSYYEARPRGRSGGGFVALLFKLVLWMIPLSMLGGGGYYAYTQWKAIAAKPEVMLGIVQTMTTGEAEKLLSAKGYLKSRNQALIGAKVPGRVQELKFEEGNKVKKGELLAIIEHTEIDAQLASRKAQLARAEADVLEAQADLDEKIRRSQRADRLAQRANLSIEEKEQTDAAVKKSAAHVASLKATTELQKQMIREMEVMLENMFIRAPFDGTVVKKGTEIGEMIAGGSLSSGGGTVGAATVATLANLGRMDVETDVSEGMLGRLAIGQPSEISVSAVPNKRYRGRLRQIIPMSDRGRGTVKVMVEFLEPDDQLFPELVATVHFLPDKALKAPDAGKAFLFLPKTAIIEEGGHSYVFTIDNKKLAHKMEVDVVVTNDDLARLEKGLKSGDSVVVNPPKTLKDGDAVKVAE